MTNDVWKACAVLDNLSFGLDVGGLLEVATTLCSEVCTNTASMSRSARRSLRLDPQRGRP